MSVLLIKSLNDFRMLETSFGISNIVSGIQNQGTLGLGVSRTA